MQIDDYDILPPKTRLLCNLPIFHCFGYTTLLWFAATRDILAVTTPSPLDFARNLQAIREEKVNVLLSTPTFLRSYIKKAPPEYLDSVRLVVAGAEKTPEGFAAAWEKKFPQTRYLEGYGMTEASPVVSVNKPDVEDAKKGTFQRVMLAIGREFTLTKKCWDKFSFEQIEEAGNPESGSSVAAVLMQSGLANICIVGKNTTILKRKITKSIPKVKAHGSNGKSVTEKQKFYELVANALITDVNIDDMKCIILASPGFYATEFEKFLSDNAARFKLQNAFSSKKFVVAAVSDAHLPSLESLLAKPEMERHVAHLKSAVQAKIWDTFMRRMTTDVSMVAIGSANVEKCREMGALEHVLVTEKHILSMKEF